MLETIFRETWTNVVEQATAIESSGGPIDAQLRAFAAFYLGTWLTAPSLASVMIREVARSPHVGQRVGVLRDALAALRRMIEAAQARGEIRADCDPQLATWAFYGTLEEILGGWVLGQLPGGQEDVEHAVATVVDVFSVGFTA